MQTIPPIDKESQVAILEWIDYEIEKEYGSAMWEEFRTLQENLEEDGYGLGDPRIDRIVENNLAGSEALWKDLDELENAYGDKLDAWNRIARKGLSYKKFTERWGESEKYESFEFESYDAPDFLFVQLSVKLQRSFADKNIANRLPIPPAIIQIEKTNMQIDELRHSQSSVEIKIFILIILSSFSQQ